MRRLFKRGEGLSWHRPAWLIDGLGDTVSDATSSLIILEDGIPLGPARAKHVDIRTLGAGRYSHWAVSGVNPNQASMLGDIGVVIFSSSDNTDPNINGRRYDFVFDGDVEGMKEENKINRMLVSDFLCHCRTTFHSNDHHGLFDGQGKAAQFVAHISRCLRTEFIWGDPQNSQDDLKDKFLYYYTENRYVLCGQLCRLLADCSLAMGLKARYVLFGDHVGIEVEVIPGSWCYFDPAFQFFAHDDGIPFDADYLASNLDFVKNWERYHSSMSLAVRGLHQHIGGGFTRVDITKANF